MGAGAPRRAGGSGEVARAILVGHHGQLEAALAARHSHPCDQLQEAVLKDDGAGAAAAFVQVDNGALKEYLADGRGEGDSSKGSAEGSQGLEAAARRRE